MHEPPKTRASYCRGAAAVLIIGGNTMENRNQKNQKQNQQNQSQNQKTQQQNQSQEQQKR